MSELAHIKNYLKEGSIDYQRLFAFHRKATALGYPEGHLWMACIAAFPAFLTPDLLYKLWLNFRQINRKDKQKVFIDRMAVSDVLLSDLVEEIAVEVYAMRPPIRTALLALIDYEISHHNVAQDLMKRLADFVLRYVRNYQMEGESVTTAIREAQEWNALAYFNPSAAVNELKKALSQAAEQSAHQKLLRINLLLQQIDDQQLALNQTEQRSQFRTLVDYSQGMQAFIRGNQQEAVEKFKSLPNTERDKVTTGGKSIQLPIPKQIYKAITAEQAQSQQRPRQLFATLIGIDIHQASAKLPKLTGAVNDADSWRKYLLERFTENPQIHSLQNGAATKEAVLDVIKLQCKQAQAGDHLFFFFAGHGQNQADGQTFNTIILHDYDAANPTQGLIAENEFRLLTDQLIPPGVSFTLMLDTHAGSSGWLDTHHPDGRYIYSACTNTQRTMEWEGSGIFTASVLNCLNERGDLPISHQDLLRKSRKEMIARNDNPSQTAIWFGAPQAEGKAFLSENSWSNLRLRERLVENGLISSIAEKEIEQALVEFGEEWAIPSDIELEKALAHKSLIGEDESLRVFISKANNQLPLTIYEDILKKQNISSSIYVHEVVPGESKGNNLEQAEEWLIELQAAHLILLHLDQTWITAEESTRLSREIQILRMVSDVPVLLLYVENCYWQTRLVGQLGTPWPAEALLDQYKGGNDPALIDALDNYLSGHLSYFKPFFSDPALLLDLSVYQTGLLEQLLEMAGRFHPKEVAYLDSRGASKEQKAEFVGANFPIPLGKAIQGLFRVPQQNEPLAPSLNCYSISVSYLNILLLGFLQRIAESGEEGAKKVLALQLADKLQQANWLTLPATSQDLLQQLVDLPSSGSILEAFQSQLESLVRLSKSLPLPSLVDTYRSPKNPEAAFTLQQAISQNYNILARWLPQLECLMDQDLSTLAQLYSLRDHTPFLFKDASFNPFEATEDQYLFVQYEPSTQVITYESIDSGKKLEIGPENRPYIPLWENFQAYWASLTPAETPHIGPPQQVHALLVGIDQYPSPLPSLQAPKADAQRLEAYLNRQPLPALTETLGGAVTKGAIVDTLVKIIDKADTGDAVIFYFSGLGQKEQSPNPKETIPALICYDQERITIDEIVYLLCRNKEKSLHPIIILDTGTSDLETKETAGAGLRPKGIASIAPRRAWEEYIFAKDIASMESWQAFMTEAGFVLIVACDYDNETAYEQGDSSLFTENLIQVLDRSQHSISYPLLQERLAQFLENQAPQRPDIQVEGERNTWQSDNFLGQASIDFQPIYGTVGWNRRLQKWTLDIGNLFGVQVNSIVHLCQNNLEGNQIARISEVYPEYAVLAFGDVLPNWKENYRGYLDEFLVYEPMKLALNIASSENQAGEELLSLLSNEFPSLSLNAPLQDADFILSQDGEEYSIASTPQAENRLHRLPINAPSEVSKALTPVIRKMAQWQALKSIKNLDVTQDPFADSELKVELFTFKGKEKIAHPLVGKEVEIPFGGTGDGQTLSEKLQLQVTNLSDRSQYFTLVYLPLDFTIVTNLLAPPIIPIKAGETFDNIEWELSLMEMVVKENWPNSRFYIKVLASDQPFDLSLWQQSGLHHDGQFIKANEQEGLEPIRIKHDNLWIVDTITIIQPNPFFKEEQESAGPSIETLRQLLVENKAAVFIDELFPLLPVDSDAFRDLIMAGSRWYHNEASWRNGIIIEAEYEIHRKRLYPNLLRILDKPEVERALEDDPPSVSVEANARRFLYSLLLKKGSTKALDQIPSYFTDASRLEETKRILREKDYNCHVRFSQSILSYEEHMVAYSRQLPAIVDWISEFDINRIQTANGTPTPIQTDSSDPDLPNWKENKANLRNLIGNDNIQGCFEELLNLFPNHTLTQELYLFQVDYQIRNKWLNEGQIDQENYERGQNRTRYGLLSLIDAIIPLQLHQSTLAPKTERQQLLINQVTAGKISETLTELLASTSKKQASYPELLKIDGRLKELRTQSIRGVMLQSTIISEQVSLAKSLLAIIEQLPATREKTPTVDPKKESAKVAEKSLFINRQSQVNAFRSFLGSQGSNTLFFLIPCPPKSEPQHMLNRLGWEFEQLTNAEVTLIDTIHIDIEQSTRKLSNQLEKATAQRFGLLDSNKENTIYFPIHIEGDWDSNRDVLLDWIKKQAEKLFSYTWAKSQFIIPIAIDFPAKDQGSISKIFRGNRFENRLRWLENLGEQFPGLVLLPSLEQVQWPALEQWLQEHFEHKSAMMDENEIGVIKDFIAQNQLDLAFDKLDTIAFSSEEEREQFLLLKGKFSEIARSNRLAIISSADYQVALNKLIVNLLNFIQTLSPTKTGDLSLTQTLQEGLGRSQDGYHMEDILRLVNSDTFQNTQGTIKVDNEEEVQAAWDQALYYGDQASYDSYLTAFPKSKNAPLARKAVERLESVQLTHRAEPLPISPSSSSSSEELTHRVQISIAGDKAELAAIESVTYYLHRSFKNNVITVDNPANNFRLNIQVWGTFDIKADVKFKDGVLIKLERYLDIPA